MVDRSATIANNESIKGRIIKGASGVLYSFFALFTVLTVTGAFAERYLMDNWGDLGADEVVYHLRSSLDGTEPGMIRDAFVRYGLPAVFVIALIIGVLLALRKNRKYRRVWVALALFAEAACVFSVKRELDDRLNFTNYLRWNLSGYNSDFIEDHYVDTGKVRLEFPERKRNLIFIFLESLEMTYSDAESGGAFERNVIPELTALAQENEDFSGDGSALNGGISLPGSTWTMGAMFSISTGMPLKVPINGNHIADEEHFFPGIMSLGDILHDEGYRQELLIGSKGSFGGRDLFYNSHGGFLIHDFIHARENKRIPEDYHVFWGYEDEKLFAFAKEDLLELAGSGEPFDLTMLTVDTHFENGYRCRLCRDEFGDQYADVFACSSRQVTEFVRWVQEQDFYENTTIVVAGDHPTMDVDFCKDVPEDYQRKTYVAIINGAEDVSGARGASGAGNASGKNSETRREYSTFDLFPTTLAAMGVSIPGNRLGLGVNLYSDERTIIEKYGVGQCASELEMPSRFMEELSGIRITEETLQEIAEKVTIRVEAGDGGKVSLSLQNVGQYLNYKSVRRMEVEITNKKTGDTKTLLLKPVFESKENINKYFFNCEVDGEIGAGGSGPENLEAVYYITAGEFEHYRIADLENNLFVEEKK